ncbi:hypothetical protein BJX76DRAFT_366937 [Aspergillus varians]
MAKAAPNPPPPPTLTRWYIDTRPLTLSTTTLPLLTTLQPPDQTSVQKFYHLKDKHMSLASNLLKYFFIHRTCRIPWSSIVISRTPDPHRRPCFIPDSSQSTGDSDTVVNVEFNVSHQASMVAIAGTTIYTNPGTDSTTRKPEVGIDITCVDERKNRSGGEWNLQSLRAYIDVFSEVFSAGEIEDMKRLHGSPSSPGSSTSTADDSLVEYGYRLFYTYWALKEAYIKMTGEALLARWLRDLEFGNVIAPVPVPVADGGDGRFGEPYTGVKTTLNKDNIEDVRIEVVALENDYIFATAARGGGIGAGSRQPSGCEGQSEERDPWMPFEKLDIERDIRPCATGVCGCLS